MRVCRTDTYEADCLQISYHNECIGYGIIVIFPYQA